MSQPRADRPNIPAGYLEGDATLPWSWAERRLERSRNYWVCTTSDDSAPHARPVWGVWIDGALYFSTGSRIGRHLEQRPTLSVNLESGDDAVILEGEAEPVIVRADVERALAVYNPKYSWQMDASEPGWWVLRPRIAFGWRCDGTGEDGGGLFGATATRWTFG